jgi:hypothetical protein
MKGALTRVKMHVRNVQDLQELSTGLLGGRKRIRLGLCKPVREVQRRRRRKRAQAQKVLAQELTIQTGHVRIGENLSDDAAQSEAAERVTAGCAEVELVTEGDGELGSHLGRSERDELADLEGGLAFGAGAVEVRVARDGADLLERVLEDERVGRTGRKRVRIRRVILLCHT